jgi:hypothetical protein
MRRRTRERIEKAIDIAQDKRNEREKEIGREPQTQMKKEREREVEH